MIKVGIVGATGYGGRELLRLLCAHPQVTVTAAASTSVSGDALADELPAFAKLIDLEFETFDATSLAARCDVVFVGVPGKASMAPVAALHEAGICVIDIGPDFRLQDLALFQKYYGVEHIAPELVQKAVYGFPAWYRDALRQAEIIAVPGCYPVSMLTPLRPLTDAPVSRVPIVIDSISGISGAGKSLSQAFHFPEMNENLKAYKIGVHQHIPEVEQELLNRFTIQFTPHVGPLTRGILTTITLRPETLFDPAPYYACYADEPFIRVLGAGKTPDINQVRASNFCDFGWVCDERTGNIVMVSAIDNLMGGTAGMAVQCMNIRFGLEENTGLKWAGMAP
ncbi:MAG TPA: N-acetyl-gamma-glutamyl-phosphate reductase [Candidatus Hydrogenedentes bacterium]|jgi:N-acetyl-gamma-glutamyl-phosphate reductase|nr:N-acetyl-gamma-glutamyl-phosphate reductase [Candidatus Hydrogenedentota bacterium]HPX86522.1 N-acetyl-gamma-glutamyl-phosphate reductase [Candidatus Hydrogenedentota bacterium]